MFYGGIREWAVCVAEAVTACEKERRGEGVTIKINSAILYKDNCHDYARPRTSQLKYMVSTWICVSSTIPTGTVYVCQFAIWV